MSALLTLWVALGGAVGSVLRFWVSHWSIGRFGASFPWGTLLVNAAGSLLIGVVAGMSLPGGRLGEASGFRAFFAAGVCGGFTTFSAFSLQTLELLRERAWFGAGLNVLLSVFLCLAATFCGFWLGTKWAK